MEEKYIIYNIFSQKAPKWAFWVITKTVFKEEKNACVLTYLEEKEDEKKSYFWLRPKNT